MDTGKRREDYTFYEGFEGEPEVILYLGDIVAVHIWGGYLDDILCAPSLDGNGWTGFTRDYHQCERTFSDRAGNTGPVQINPHEYLMDLLQYQEKSFDCEETPHVFDTIAKLLREAIRKGLPVAVEVS